MDGTSLPFGVEIFPLSMHRDQRGWVSEFYRAEWLTGVAPCQWNATFSEPAVLRGVHVHHRHKDYLVVARGRISVGLYDLRHGSPTHRRSALLELSGDRLSVLTIPTGVMHGYYSHEPTLYMYGVDSYYDPADELGCHWADPGLGIAWPCADPVLSERDRSAGSLAELDARFHLLHPAH